MGVEANKLDKESEAMPPSQETIAALPDARLQKRYQRLVEQLSRAPGASIPQACGSDYEAKAAYRFLG